MIHVVTTEVSLVPWGKPLFDENTTTIRVVDDAAGPFIVIQQEQTEHHSDEINEIRLCKEELQGLIDAIDIVSESLWQLEPGEGEDCHCIDCELDREDK